MTHLRIELNNGVIEEVSSAVIDKLYDIVHSGNLDNTSNLIGRLHTSATYQDYIDYLEDAFKVNGVKLLIIDATKKYISFADSAVASYWANSTYGDGVGLTETEAAAITSWPKQPGTNNIIKFTDNTSITSFDELYKFINLKTIPGSMFNGCSNLTSIRLDNITTINDSGGFINSGLIGTLDLPNLTSTGRYPFLGCTLLEEVNIGADVPVGSKIQGLGLAMFSGCTSLLKVTGLSEVTYINSSAFNGCTSLEEVDISNSCTGIVYEYSFLSCSNLKCVNISKATEIRYRAFLNCTNLLDLDTSDPTLASSVEKTIILDAAGTIGLTAFLGTKLTNKIINIVNVTGLGNGAFEGTEIKEVYAPNCTTLGDNPFKGCSNLVKVTIDGSTSIGIRAFLNCTNLLNLTVLSTIPGTLNTTAFEGASNCIIYVPASSISDYQNASGWSTYASRIQAIPT